VQGHEVHYAPGAVCYHHHSSTSKKLPLEMIRLLQTRNPVLACFKNYDDANLRAVLGPLLALYLRRMWCVSGLSDDRPFRIEQAANPAMGGVKRLWDLARSNVQDEVGVRRVAAADLIGINDFLGRFAHWSRRRAEVQARRRRPDGEIFQLFLKPHWCIEGEAGYQDLQRGLEKLFGFEQLFPADALPDPKK
jgi:hypothetical protein